MTPVNGTLTEAARNAGFVISLGRALLQDKTQGWVDMAMAAKCCREHGIQIDGHKPEPSQLERVLRSFFQGRDEFSAPGLTLDGYERRIGWDLVFQIRVYPNRAAQLPTSGLARDCAVGNPKTATLREITPNSPGERAREKSI